MKSAAAVPPPPRGLTIIRAPYMACGHPDAIWALVSPRTMKGASPTPLRRLKPPLASKADR